MMRLMAWAMPACRDVARLVSDGMDHRLPWRQRVLIRMHVTLCALCRRYERQLHLLREGVRRYADPEQGGREKSLSPPARERLKQALNRRG